MASASVASDATKLTGGDEDDNEAPATLVAIPVCVSAPPEIEIEILDTEYLHSLKVSAELSSPEDREGMRSRRVTAVEADNTKTQLNSIQSCLPSSIQWS